MESLLQKIEEFKQEVAAAEANTAELVEAFRIKYLGTKGLVKSVMGEMKSVPNEHKKAFGQVLNDFKLFVESKFDTLKENAVGGSEVSGKAIDLSLPGDPIAVGARHPLNIVRNQIVSIFQRLAQFRSHEFTGRSSCSRHAGYFLYQSKSSLVIKNTYE